MAVKENRTSKINIEKITYKNFGNCLRLTNGIIEAVVTVDFGPRIIKFAYIDGENFLFEDTDRKCVTKGEMFDAIYGKDKKFYNYGGHRLWLSPENLPLTYYPDNEAVSYKEIENGVELTAPAQRVNNVQYRFELIMSENSPVMTVNHYAKNLGSSTINKAMWAVSMMTHSGLEIIPQPINDTGLLPNRSLALWPYSDMTDERIYWGKKYITLKQDPTITSAFKFGISNDRGWAAYLVNGGMFIKKYNTDPKGVYPDNGVSYETYTNNLILEMESLNELSAITPGSTAFHTEEWTIENNVVCPNANDEGTIDTLVNLYIEK